VELTYIRFNSDVAAANQIPLSTDRNGTGTRFPFFAYLSSRLNSYETWPKKQSQKPKEMADAGWYYVGKLKDTFFSDMHA
jgi:hypothetical protein